MSQMRHDEIFGVELSSTSLIHFVEWLQSFRESRVACEIFIWFPDWRVNNTLERAIAKIGELKIQECFDVMLRLDRIEVGIDGQKVGRRLGETLKQIVGTYLEFFRCNCADY